MGVFSDATLKKPVMWDNLEKQGERTSIRNSFIVISNSLGRRQCTGTRYRSTYS
jgi:hypothetical protein